MRQNPVYSREMKVSARSPRFPLILSLFNGILCLAALINMYSVVLRVRTNATIQYSSFMDIYEFVTAIEFILLMFIVPAVTAASISGERERQTLDLMLTTQMTAAQIVTGKLMGALSSLFVLILSSFPAVAMVFVYGGITWWDALSLIFCYVAVAFMAGSLGIFFSSVFRRSTVSTAVTYGTLIAFVAGTYFINRFALSMSAANLDQTIAAYAMEAPAIRAFFRRRFLSLFDESGLYLYGSHWKSWPGAAPPLPCVCSILELENTGFVMEHWVLLSILLQLAAGALLLWEAVQFLEPVKKKGKRKK
mgnify:CR=1 FL=1